MKYFFLILLLPDLIFAQEVNEVTFRVKAGNIPDSTGIFICGNIPELGDWQPDKIPLEKKSGNIWERSFTLPAGKNIEYKITRGSWNTEAVKKDGEIPGNSKLVVKNDTTIEIEIEHWKDQFHYTLKGQVTGRVDYYRNIKGEGILPRDLLVWLPPGYETDTTSHYPVLYMQDAQNLFDPYTSSFGVDWQLDETADSLIRNNIIKPVIIAGLTCTSWRGSEYSDNDTGFAYMKFLVSKVKPFIDSTYRTLKEPENTVIGGASLGALISFMLAWNYPDIFSMVICMSPALKIDHIDYVKNVNDYKGPIKNLKFYFDAGTDSLDSRLKIGTLKMIKTLESKGYKMGRDILWFEDPAGYHSEASWAERVLRPLHFFFGK